MCPNQFSLQLDQDQVLLKMAKQNLQIHQLQKAVDSLTQVKK